MTRPDPGYTSRLRPIRFIAVASLLSACPKVASAPQSVTKSKAASAAVPTAAGSGATRLEPLPDDPVARVEAAKAIVARSDPEEMKSYTIELESEDSLRVYVRDGQPVRFELDLYTDGVETYEEEDTVMAEGEERTLVRNWYFHDGELFAVTDDLEVTWHEGAEGTIYCVTTDVTTTYYVQGSQLLGTSTLDETDEECTGGDDDESEFHPVAVDSEIRPQDSPIGALLAKEGARLWKIAEGKARPKFELHEI